MKFKPLKPLKALAAALLGSGLSLAAAAPTTHAAQVCQQNVYINTSLGAGGTSPWLFWNVNGLIDVYFNFDTYGLYIPNDWTRANGIWTGTQEQTRVKNYGTSTFPAQGWILVSYMC